MFRNMTEKKESAARHPNLLVVALIATTAFAIVLVTIYLTDWLYDDDAGTIAEWFTGIATVSTLYVAIREIGLLSQETSDATTARNKDTALREAELAATVARARFEEGALRAAAHSFAQKLELSLFGPELHLTSVSGLVLAVPEDTAITTVRMVGPRGEAIKDPIERRGMNRGELWIPWADEILDGDSYELTVTDGFGTEYRGVYIMSKRTLKVHSLLKVTRMFFEPDPS